MLSLTVLSLAGSVRLAPVQNAPPAPAFDVVGNVFSAEQRKAIGRDAQCADARSAADRFAETNGKDVAVAMTALRAIEHCASLRRVGDWKEYDDYLWTAAAGIAYDVGIVSLQPKGFQHAIVAAKNVSGFQEPVSKNVEQRSASPSAPSSSTTAGTSNGSPPTLFANRSGLGNAANAQTDAGLPDSNNAHVQTQSVHTAGYSGNYGSLAKQIADAAQRALDISNSASR